MLKFDLVCLGELLVDLFPAEVGRKLAEVTAFRPKPGGAPANVAVAAARLGLKAAFIGKVGDEAFGHMLLDTVQREGVDTSGMRLDAEARTTLAFIAMPDVNTSEFIFYRNPGADLRLNEEELDRDLLRSARAFHCGSLSLGAEPARTATHIAVDIARTAGALVSFDVNYRASLWKSTDEALECIWKLLPKANLLKVNEVELKLLSGRDGLEQAAGSLLGKGPELIVVTLGAQGSFYCTAQTSGFVEAFKVETVDATGCGDAFIAGLLSRLVRAGDWRSHLTTTHLYRDFRYANAVGAITALTLGVIPALPSAEQVDRFLENNPEK